MTWRDAAIGWIELAALALERAEECSRLDLDDWSWLDARVDEQIFQTMCDPRRCRLRDQRSGSPEMYGSGGHLYSWDDHCWFEVTWKGRRRAERVLPCMRARGPEWHLGRYLVKRPDEQAVRRALGIGRAA